MKLEIIVTHNLINYLSVTVLFILTTLILFVSSFSFSTLVLFWTLFCVLNFLIKEDRLKTLFSFTLGVIFMVALYHYWTILYGNSYFLGKMSDDWQYDILWTEGYISKYGVSVFGLFDHLNDIKPGLGILHNSKAYVMVVIFLKYFASFFDGYHTLLPRVLNIFFLTLTAYYSSLIAYNQFMCIKTRRLTFLSVFFFPVMLFNSSHIFRDILISLILVYTYYITSTKKYSFSTIIKIIPLLLILLFLRSTTFFVSILMLLLIYSNIRTINIRLFLILIFFFITSLYFFDSFLADATRQISGYNKLNSERFGTIGSAIFSLPLYQGFIPRIVYLLFTPVPNFSGIHQLFLSISSFIQILSFPYLISAFNHKNIDIRLKLIFVLFFLGVAFSSADFRHVMMYLPFGIILTVISYNTFIKEEKSNNYYFLLLAILFLLFIISVGVALTLK